MGVKVFKHKIWNIVPFIVLFIFTLEMTLIVTILLQLPQLLIAFLPLYIVNMLLLIKFLKKKDLNEQDV